MVAAIISDEGIVTKRGMKWEKDLKLESMSRGDACF